MRQHTRCPSVYTTQEAEPHSNPAHIFGGEGEGWVFIPTPVT